MPLSQIENYLYEADLIGHAVMNFEEKSGTIVLTIAPWPYTNDPDPDMSRKKVAAFDNAVITSREILEEGATLEYPWDIIGFDSYERGNDRYEFVLHCDEIEIAFESLWPKLLNQERGTNCQRNGI